MTDTYDRPGKAFAAGTYAGAGKYTDGVSTGVRASAGVGHARAEWSVFDAEAKGPNASAEAGASAASLSAGAFARAELASASASAGPLKATVGLAADTGASVGLNGVEAKVLGTGFSIGRKVSISLFGSEIGFKLW